MKHRATTNKSAARKWVPSGAWLTPPVDDDPLVASIHRNDVDVRPIDGSLGDMTSILVAMEIIRRQTFSTKVARSDSLLRMSDARVLRSVPTVGVC